MMFALSFIATALTADADITIGSDNQLRSNPELDDDEDEYDMYDTATLTLTNDGSTTINVTVEYPTDSKYNITFDKTFPLQLNSGESQTITVNSRIPEDWPSFWESDPDKEKDTIGNLVFKNDDNNSESATTIVYMQAENFLEIEKVYISVNEGSKKDYEDGDTVENLKPADKLEISVKAENKYDDDDPEDLDFDDANIAIYADENEFDIDEDEDVDVDAKSSTEYTFDIVEIEYDVEDGDATLTVTLVGEDTNGAKQGQEIEIELELDKENDEIAITDFDDLIQLTCNDGSIDLQFTIVNVGSRDQDDDVDVRVTSSDFSFSERREDFSLDEGEDEELSFDIPVPSDIDAGSKTIKITTYYDRTKESNEETITVTVPDCGRVQEPELECTKDSDCSAGEFCNYKNECQDVPEDIDEGKDDEDTTVVIIGDDTDDDVSPIIAGTQVSTVEEGFVGSTLYIVILVVAILIAVSSLALSLAVLFKKK